MRLYFLAFGTTNCTPWLTPITLPANAIHNFARSQQQGQWTNVIDQNFTNKINGEVPDTRDEHSQQLHVFDNI